MKTSIDAFCRPCKSTFSFLDFVIQIPLKFLLMEADRINFKLSAMCNHDMPCTKFL